MSNQALLKIAQDLEECIEESSNDHTTTHLVKILSDLEDYIDAQTGS